MRSRFSLLRGSKELQISRAWSRHLTGWLHTHGLAPKKLIRGPSALSQPARARKKKLLQWVGELPARKQVKVTNQSHVFAPLGVMVATSHVHAPIPPKTHTARVAKERKGRNGRCAGV